MQQASKVHPGFRGFHADAHHAVYEHDNTPHELHVTCPACARKAIARNSRWVNAKAGVFEVRCSSCLFRKSGFPYQELPPLFYRVGARGTELWAWNRSHLEELLSFLESPHARQSSILRSYVRREWLLRRRALVKAIRARLRAATSK